MAGAFVASAAAEAAASSTTIAVTPGTNPTTGNLLWVVVRSDTDTTCTVADSLGNTFTPIGSIVEAGTGDELFHFYAKNVTGGANTITATFGAASISRGIYVEEWSGLDATSPLVAHHEVTDTGNNPTGNASNTNGGVAGVLLSFNNQVNGTGGITVGTGMTVRSATAWSTDTARGLSQYRVLAADTGTYTSNVVNPSFDRVNQTAAIFKEQGVTPLPQGRRAKPRYGFVRRPFDIAALLPRVRVESWFWQGWWPAPASDGSISGSGALVSGSATISGSGSTSSTGTGSLSAQSASVSGTGATSSTGTGALVSGSATISGSGSTEWVGSGALQAASSTISGSGATSSTGTGALAAQASTIAGSGTTQSDGSGALAASSSTISGTGAVGSSPITGTGALAAGSSTVSGTGSTQSSGTGALAAQSATISGAGTSESSGSGLLAAQASAIAGSGTVTSGIDGSGSLSAGSSSINGVGEVTGTPAVEQGIGQGAGPGIGRFRVSSPSRNFVIDYEGLGRVYLPPDVPRETQKPSVYATPFPAVPLPPVPTRTSAQIINQAIARANEAAMQEAERASERAKEQARKSALIRAIVLAVAVADDD